jgi:hypothetical protein
MNATTRNACIAVVGLFATLPAGALAQRESSIQPVVLESADSNGATIGIQWNYSGTAKGKTLPSDSITIQQISLDYKLSGTATAEKERNPKNFIDALVDAKLLYSHPDRGAISGGFFAKYEADQSFENRQPVYGLRVTTGKLGLLHDNNLDFIALDVNLGRVNPSKDLARQAALGTPDLDQYYRWDLEFLYIYPVASRHLERIEFNYRYFREDDPPAAVRAAGLSQHKLYTVHFGLKNDFFVAYSKGNLPFDRTSDKIFELGWSHKLE